MNRDKDISITDAYFRVGRKDLALFKFLMEGYDGLVTVTTVDPQKACVRVSALSAAASEVEEIISAIKREFLPIEFETVGANAFSNEEEK